MTQVISGCISLNNRNCVVALMVMAIGGACADIALECCRQMFSTTVLTNHTVPEQTILDGIAILTRDAGITAADLDVVNHGMMLTTNALIERRGASTAPFTTRGFRDVIKMSPENRLEQCALNLKLPMQLILREDRFIVAGRVGAQGRKLTPLDEAALGANADHIAAGSFRAGTNGSMHFYVNPARERRAKEIVAARGKLPISI